LKGFALEKVNISHSAISGSQAVVWVIQDAGIFRKHGLETQILFITGGPTTIASLVSGDVQFAVFAGPAAVTANLAGADVVVLMSFLNTLDHSFFSAPAIKKPSDLKGKKFGINRYGAADDYGLRLALKKWGLDPDRDVTTLQLGGQPARLAALQGGHVDATLLQLPWTVKARQAGFNEFASLADMRFDYLGTSLVTTRTLIRKQESLVRRFVRAFVEGIHFYKTNQEASLRHIAKFAKLQDAVALGETYNAYALKFMASIPYPNLKGVEAILEDLARRNPAAKEANARTFVEPRFLKELEDSGFIAKLYGR
jgi:NitT/TauT family transport system substrate-binding protein